MRLGTCEVDTSTGEVRRGDLVVRLEPQPAALLRLLASRPGELVAHAEIRRAIWGDTTHVNFQQSLHYCVRQVRIALDDSAREPKFVETIPRRGYRLRIPEAEPLDVTIPSPASRRSYGTIGRRVLWAALAGALVVTTIVVEQRPNQHHEMAVAVLTAVHDLVY
jgi:DNA-binding winged helix-turn-helix (wHTH) protein